jgi:hypothetical protein
MRSLLRRMRPPTGDKNMNKRTPLAAALALGTTLFASTAAEAGLFRAYLSRSGSDAADCSLATPCRLLPAALSVVNDGGEIWMLDSANFNSSTVTIDKSVTILAVPGAMGSVVGNGGDAVVLQGVGIKVAMRNLTILNITGGNYGVRVENGFDLVLDHVEVHGFSVAGLFFNTTVNAVVNESVIRGNNHGIDVDNGAQTTVNRSMIVNNSGIGFSTTSTVSQQIVTTTIRDSVVSNNGSYGVLGLGSAGTVRVFVKNSDTSRNALDGVIASGNGATGTTKIVISGVTSNRNSRYGYALFGVGVSILSDGTNLANDNVTANTNVALGAATTY